MFEGPKKNENALDSLKKRLYTRGELGRRAVRRGRLETHEENVQNDWKKEPAGVSLGAQKTEKMKMGMFKKFFIGALVFFIAAISYASYQFFAGGNLVSTRNIDMAVFGPAFASGGDELSLQVSIQNRNSVPLEFAQLFMEYPKGATSPGASSTPEMVRNQIPLDKIPAGGTEQQVVKATLYGEEGSGQSIKFTLEYRVQGSNAIFQKETAYSVKISSAPVNLSLVAPQKTNAGQTITFNVKVSSNAPKNIPNVLLEVGYPPGFLYKSANPEPTYGDNVWHLGDFNLGSERTVKVTGVFSGQNGEERTLRILAGSPSLDDEKTVGVIYNSIFQTVAILRPFLDAQVLLNGNSGDKVAIPGGSEVKGFVIWKNNLPTRITDADISIKFSGNAINRASVSSESGFYNSSENVITWDKNTVSDFQTVEPGATGQFPFSFASMPLFQATSGLLNNPEINLQIIVKGNVNTGDGSGGATSVITEKVARVSSDLQLLSRAVYFTGPFANTGPIPPFADRETTYTVLWNVTNSSNDITNVIVTTILPQYVSWAGKTYPETEDVSYNDANRTVTWLLPSVLASTGYQKPAREAAWQIKLVPSLSHVGSSVGLTGGVSFLGTDSFSGGTLQGSKDALTTLLNSDPSFKSGNDIVRSPTK